MNIHFKVFLPLISRVYWLEVCFPVGIIRVNGCFKYLFDKIEDSSDSSGLRGRNCPDDTQENTGYNRRIGRGKSVMEDLKNQVKVKLLYILEQEAGVLTGGPGVGWLGGS